MIDMASVASVACGRKLVKQHDKRTNKKLKRQEGKQANKKEDKYAKRQTSKRQTTGGFHDGQM